MILSAILSALFPPQGNQASAGSARAPNLKRQITNNLENQKSNARNKRHSLTDLFRSFLLSCFDLVWFLVLGSLVLGSFRAAA